ncbi:MAG TPA: SDR family NAD(P)-dependent oxidoreductase [Terriglobales bacterium]|nr:SDR family NAD(P)-dependent oxidoreductase [Terriglobales bacterium]
MQRFADKVAVITGAASGIGRATAVRLAGEGARLALLDLQHEPLEALTAELHGRGSEVAAIRCDVSDAASVRAAVAAVIERFGRIDVLCNIAGILRFDHTHELALDDWNQILAVNLTGTFLMCQAAIPHLLASRGNIVNMSSTAGISAHPWTAAYSASKGGVLALTLALALEYGKQGLRVNCACPGAIKTPIRYQFHLPDGADAKLLERIMPFNGFGSPESCAAAIAFLASDDASHIHGTALRVDGGMLM